MNITASPVQTTPFSTLTKEGFIEIAIFALLALSIFISVIALLLSRRVPEDQRLHVIKYSV